MGILLHMEHPRIKPICMVQCCTWLGHQNTWVIEVTFKPGARQPGFLELLLSVNVGMLACMCPP